MIVTHGIFNCGTTQLEDVFDTIYTTDSIHIDINNPKIKVITIAEQNKRLEFYKY